MIAALLGAAFLLLSLLAAGGLLAVYARSGPIVPGVRVGGTGVGGLSLAQAAARIDQEWNQDYRITVLAAGQRFDLPPAALGLKVDAQASAQMAWQARRAGSALELLLAALEAQDAPLTPYITFDPAPAQAGLEQLAAALSVPAVDARIEFRDGHFTALPAQTGRALDTSAGLEALQHDPALVMLAGAIELPVQAVPPAVGDLSAEAAALEARRSRPLAVQVLDPVSGEQWAWTLDGEALAAAARFENSPQGPRFYLDQAALDGWLQSQAASLGDRTAVWRVGPEQADQAWESGQPLRAELRRPPTSYIVQPGETLMQIAWKVGIPYWRILQANPDVDGLSAGQTIRLPSKNDQLPLPVVWEKRIAVSIAQQRMVLYQDGALLTEYVISTGMADSPTQPGVYQIQTHELSAYASNWDLTMPHFMGIYEAWPGFMNGIHGLPTLSSGRLLWAGALGRPASYGCIILSLEDAADLYSWAEDGVVIEIQP